jgi:hypothetical protein
MHPKYVFCPYSFRSRPLQYHHSTILALEGKKGMPVGPFSFLQWRIGGDRPKRGTCGWFGQAVK